MDIVGLSSELSVIVGILPRERVEPQPIRVDVEMFLELGACADTGDLSASVDYGEVDAQLRFLATHGRFRLIESLGLAIARMILLPPAPGEARAPVARVSVTIRKPTVLRAAEPRISLVRDPSALDGEWLIRVPEVEARRVRGARPNATAVHELRPDLFLAVDRRD